MMIERLLQQPYGRWVALAITNWAWMSVALSISVRTTLAWNAPTGCLMVFLWVATNQIYVARLTTNHDHRDFWQRYGAGVAMSLGLYVLSPGLGFCSTLLGSLYFYQRYKHVRPAKTLQEAGAATTTFAAAKTTYKGQIERGDPGIFWGGMRVPTDYATMHFLVLGTTGSGKTVTLRLYMQSVLQGIGQPGGSKRAFIYDPKGEMYSILLGMGLRDEDIAVMLPYDLRCRPWWMSKDIRSATQAETLAIILVPEKTNSKDDDYWRSTAILIIKATVRAFNKFCPERWTFRDLLLALRDQRIVTRMIAEVPALHHYAQTFGSEKTAANIMSTVISKVERFEPIAALWHKAKTEYHTEPLSLTD
ncbi:MAG: type IV secretion system DNA-binding domain-containing protein, partial [Cyanobacteria bacterium J06555_13]